MKKQLKNEVSIGNGLMLCCLCAEHKKDSTCEVYLRLKGKYKEKSVEELLKEIKKMFEESENQKVNAPYPKPPYYPGNWGGGWRCTCGQWVYPNMYHPCPNQPGPRWDSGAVSGGEMML